MICAILYAQSVVEEVLAASQKRVMLHTIGGNFIAWQRREFSIRCESGRQMYLTAEGAAAAMKLTSDGCLRGCEKESADRTRTTHSSDGVLLSAHAVLQRSATRSQSAFIIWSLNCCVIRDPLNDGDEVFF